jgi:hypothetical protein
MTTEYRHDDARRISYERKEYRRDKTFYQEKDYFAVTA